MNKPSSKRPPSERRPTRRSLVDLTAVASHAVSNSQPVTLAGSITTAVDRMPPDTRAAQMSGRQAAAKTTAVRPEPAAAPKSEELSSTDSTAKLAVKIAKEFQAGAFEGFKASMNAALDYARDLVDTGGPVAEALQSDHIAKPEDPVLTGLSAAARYRAEAFELAKANLETALDYTHELIRARTPSEFVEVGSELARKQCEFAVKQSGALKRFSQAVTKSDPTSIDS